MTAAHKVTLVIVFVFMILAGGLAGCLQVERETRIRAESTTAAQEQIVAAKEKDIAGRDALASQYSAELAKQAGAIRTPAQAVQVIEHYIPSAQPITTVAKADLPAALQKDLPDAPTFTLFTPDQVKKVAQDELACDATRHQLQACTADVTDLHAVVAAKTTEAHTWEIAAKGGTKWHRFVHVLKLTGCAAGGAGVGALAAKNNPAGPAIGAAAGVTACSLF